ncbi:MAG: cache domain-containing protein [Acetobacteraceae bacterium]|nr:cache domain-containing protein [Acetobacteraceae bacterium]
MRMLRFAAALALLLLSAIALPAAADEFATKDEAVALVKRAIARTGEIGMDKARLEFMDHSGTFVDRDLYLVIVDKAGVRLVHGQNPKLVGKTYFDAVDVNGYAYGKAVQAIAEGPGSGWISFAFKDPLTGKVLPKENYVEKGGDYIFLAGVYKR